MSEGTLKKKDNKSGIVSLVFAITLSIIYCIILLLVEFDIIKYDLADIISVLNSVLNPLIAIIPLLMGVTALYSGNNRAFAIIAIIISSLIILFSLIVWIRLFLFFGSLRSFGSG